MLLQPEREIARSASAPHGPDGALYPGTCRRLSAAEREARIAAGVPHAWRLDMARALEAVALPLDFEEEAEGRVTCHPERFGDAVLARKDVPASYHLCVTHDDAAQGVTLVTRGRDLMPATDLHRLLQALLGWPAPRYAHHALMLDASGRRLAKRDRAATLREMRASGLSPEAVRARAGFPGTGMMIRRATLADADDIARLHRAVRAECLPYLPDIHTPEEDRRFFRDRVFVESEVWVAGAQGIDGFCAWRPGWVDHLYVRTDRQGSGIGSALIARAMDAEAALRLYVFQRNARAIRFYEARGFRLVRRRDGSGNEEGEPDALYAWSRAP